MITINRSRVLRRKRRVSTNIQGTESCPRISIYRSSKHTYIQAIDDIEKKTIVGLSPQAVKQEKATKTEKAKMMGKLLAEKLKEKKIEKAVFDRGRYSYNGRVKALAEGLREGGIQV